MGTVTIPSPIHREPELPGQTVVVIGGSAGIGFETARRARAEGASVILTGRNAERLRHAASEVDALSTAAFDAADPVALDRFFRDLPTIDHVMVTAGRPYYGRLADMDFAKIRGLLTKENSKGGTRVHDPPAPDNYLDARAVRRRAHRLRAWPLEAFWQQRRRVPQGA
jgi:NAD(P)-dependent dehydrogenase (short-subunit alcohol dehydrogenase family)